MEFVKSDKRQTMHMLQQFRVYSNLSKSLSQTTEESLTEVELLYKNSFADTFGSWILLQRMAKVKGTSSY